MRILFIHEVNYLSKVIFEMHEFPELLAQRGHEVAFFHYPEAAEPPVPSCRTTRKHVQGRVHSDVTIHLITPPTWKGRGLERYLAPLTSLPALRREIRRGGYDLVVLYAVPTTGWQTVAIARRAGVPVVFRALDVSHRIRSNLLSPLIKLAERYIYRRATLISANNPAMADYCVELGSRTLPTVVNVPPIDFSHFEQPTSGKIRSQLGIPKQATVVLYMGTFFEFSGLDIVMDSMEEQLDRYPELHLVLVGGGALDAELRERSSRFTHRDRIKFTGVVPYADLPQYLKAADVAINPFRPELVTHTALPHKVLQYMAAGVPTVSTRLRGVHRLLGDDAGVTWVSEPDGVAAIASELAHRPPQTREAIRLAQRARVTTLFSATEAIEAFEATLLSVR